MKKILLLLPYFLLVFNVSAQPYKSMFGHDSTTWTVGWENIDMFGAEEMLSVEKDTVIGVFTYKKLNYLFPGPSGPCFLREDTAVGKVWFRYLTEGITLTEEELAYDFNLNVGDSFNASNMSSGYDSSFVGVVDSVTWKGGRKYIYLNYRYYYSNPTDVLYEPITFIEGIGTNMGPAWKQYHGGYRHQYLMCSTLDGEQTSFRNIRYDGTCPELWTGLENIPMHQSSITLYPNPSSDRLYISGLTQQPQQAIIFTITGQLTREVNLSSINESISTSSLPNGIYLLKILDENRIASYHRFVVHH